MKTKHVNLYSWLKGRFNRVLLSLTLMQILILALGFPLSLRIYRISQQTYLEKMARNILLEEGKPGEEIRETLDHAGPFFLFDDNRELVFSNRGLGRGIPREFQIPVYGTRDPGKLMGYYYAGSLDFLAQPANRAFAAALFLLALFSLAGSLLLGSLTARSAARQINRPVKILQKDLLSLRGLKPPPERQFPLAEYTRMSREIRRVGSVLEETERQKKQRIQNITHDLRTPLTGLRSQLEGMRDGILPATAERFNNTLREIERMEEMVHSLSLLHRIEGQVLAQKDPVAAKPFFESLAQLVEGSLREKGQPLALHVDDKDKFQADASLLHRAVLNLLTNANQYGAAGVKIALGGTEARTPQGGYQIFVWNQGTPLTQEEARPLFDRFYRGDASRHQAGSGLGLSIAQEIARLHGGTLKTAALPPQPIQERGLQEQGVCFILTLPAE